MNIMMALMMMRLVVMMLMMTKHAALAKIIMEPCSVCCTLYTAPLQEMYKVQTLPEVCTVSFLPQTSFKGREARRQGSIYCG